MNNTKSKIVAYGLLLVLVLLIAGAWLLNSLIFKKSVGKQQSSEPSQSPVIAADEKLNSRNDRKMPLDLESLVSRLNTSINVYGRVVDQFGEPVAGASVILRPHNRLQDSYGKRTVTTDADGRFSADGLYGNALGISAEKEGYLRIPAYSSVSSSASLSYDRGSSGTGNQFSVPTNPIVLELLKIGATEPMVHVDKKRWKLALDGTTQTIALNSEEGQGAHKIEFRFSSNWNKLPMDNEINSRLFDWSFEIRVPRGGLIWDESDAKFEAPASGYKEVVRYEYPSTLPREEWKRFQKGRYFVRFADDTYGRIQFQIDGSSDRSPLYMESWLNLTPSSRNLATENMIINVMESVESGR
jgi:Carboxypeptidase regulatory-like domain